MARETKPSAQYAWEQGSLIPPDRCEVKVEWLAVGPSDRFSATVTTREGVSRTLVGIETTGGHLEEAAIIAWCQGLQEILLDGWRRLSPF